MKTITLLIPVYNEEESLPILIDRLNELTKKIKNYNFEMLFVNDGSTDKTLDLLKDYASKDERVSYIDFSRNYGKEVAMIAGIDHVRGDSMVVLDADLQDPPELIPKMIKHWEEGYDDVYARRRNRKDETWLKKKTSEWYYRILQSTTQIPIQIDTGDFRLLDRKCIDALKLFREAQRNTKGMMSWIGFKKKEVLYDREPRVAGKTKWNYRKLINLAIDGLTGFTTAPLRFASIVGVAISAAAFLYILYLLIRPLFGVDTGDGYSSIMAVILFIGGIQILFLGIIGEYVARIFTETKKRPLYLINEYHEGKVTKTPN